MTAQTEEATVETGEPQANGQIKITHLDGADDDIRKIVEEKVNAKHGGSGDSVQTEVDPNEYGQADTDNEPVVENREGPLKGIAAGIVVPPELAHISTTGDYNPAEFVLMHFDVWNTLLNDLADSDEVKKAYRAHMRGMRKVNRHWYNTKRELQREKLQHTRTARKLRKARAGRDRWLRRVELLERTVATQDAMLDGQTRYIMALEQRINGARS